MAWFNELKDNIKKLSIDSVTTDAFYLETTDIQNITFDQSNSWTWTIHNITHHPDHHYTLDRKYIWIALLILIIFVAWMVTFCCFKKRVIDRLSTTLGTSLSKKKLPQYAATLGVGVGVLAIGTISAWTSQTERFIVDKHDIGYIGDYGFLVSNETWSWVGSSTPLGAVIACLLTGIIINECPRKLTMQLLAISFCIGWALVIFASNIAMLIGGRTLLGLCCGSFCIFALVYIEEIAEGNNRVFLVNYFQFMLATGILFVYAVGFLIRFELSLVCGCIPIIFFMVFAFIPESPQYFVSKNQEQKAIISLKRLHGQDYNYGPELQKLKERKRLKVSFTAFAKETPAKDFFIMFGFMFFQQMTGISVVIFYTGHLFESANYTEIEGSFSTGLIGCVYVIGTFISLFIVKKFGKWERILFLVSCLVVAICTFVLGTNFYFNENPIWTMSVFIFSYALGFGPIPWLMASEIFPVENNGFASSICWLLNWPLVFIITKIFTNMLSVIGIGPTFWLFSGFSILGTVFVWFVVPEKNGGSEIQKMSAGEKPTINNNSDNGTMNAQP